MSLELVAAPNERGAVVDPFEGTKKPTAHFSSTGHKAQPIGVHFSDVCYSIICNDKKTKDKWQRKLLEGVCGSIDAGQM